MSQSVTVYACHNGEVKHPTIHNEGAVVEKLTCFTGVRISSLMIFLMIF